MCGRVVQAKGPLQVAILCGLNVPDTRFANMPPSYNAAPSQELWAIRQNNDTGQRSLEVGTIAATLVIAPAQAVTGQELLRPVKPWSEALSYPAR